MKTIDRYILRSFALNFAILLVVLAGLFVIVNVVVDLDEFLSAGRLLQDEFGSFWLATAWAIFDFNAPILVLIYVYFSGLLVVGAMGFTFAGLLRTRELVAMVSSGVSMYRIAMPVLIVGGLLSAVSLPSQEFIIPLLASRITRSKSEIGDKTTKLIEVSFALDRNHSLLSASSFDPRDHSLSDVSILERMPSGEATGRVTADRAEWVEKNGLVGWRLINGLRFRKELARAANPVGGVKTGESVDFYPTDLSPKVLLAHQQSVYLRLLGLRDLDELRSQTLLIDPDQVLQVMHTRFSLLVMNVLILVMGLPFFLLREPANMLLQGVKAAGVCLGAWGGGLVLLQIGGDMLNPVAAAWLPVVIYLPVSAALLVQVKT